MKRILILFLGLLGVTLTVGCDMYGSPYVEYIPPQQEEDSDKENEEENEEENEDASPSTILEPTILEL